MLYLLQEIPSPVLNTSFMCCCMSLSPVQTEFMKKKVMSIEGVWAFQHHTWFSDTQSPQGLCSSESGAKAQYIPHSKAVSL